VMPCSRADESLREFSDVSPTAVTNAISARDCLRARLTLWITATVCRSSTEGASRRMRSDRDDCPRVQFVFGREQAGIDSSNAAFSSTTQLGLPYDQATLSTGERERSEREKREATWGDPWTA
jgi:hypothetical protein